MTEPKKRGLAQADRETRRRVSRLGGQWAHISGTAHEWTSEEARLAGRKGGLARAQRRQQAA